MPITQFAIELILFFLIFHSRSGEWYKDGDCMVMNLPDEDEKKGGEEIDDFEMQAKVDGQGEDDEDPPKEPRPHDLVDNEPRWIDPRQRKEKEERGEEFKECGRTKYMEGEGGTRIVGGEEADLHQFPWMVALKTEWGLQFCGGTILNERVQNS